MQQTIVLPYMRNSATRLPRRDIVLTGGDSLTLRASIVESDDPNAQALVLTGGIGGPQARIVIYTDFVHVASGSSWSSGGYGWDYGWGPGWGYGSPDRAAASILWCGYGTISTTARGSFDFFIPFSTIGALPRRCAWAMQLAWDSGRKSELLAKGTMHVSGPLQDFGDLFVWTTDTDQPITDDTGEQIFT